MNALRKLLRQSPARKRVVSPTLVLGAASIALFCSGCVGMLVQPPSIESQRKTLDDLKARAYAGDGEAEFIWAGFAPEKNVWWERASADHYLPATYQIGFATEKGFLTQGVPGDAAKAIVIYATVLDDPKCALGVQTNTRTCDQAAESFARLTDTGGPNLPANQKDVRAAYLRQLQYSDIAGYRLAELYGGGVGGPIDTARAYFFALLVSDHRTPVAYGNLLDPATAAAVKKHEADWAAKRPRGNPFPDANP